MDRHQAVVVSNRTVLTKIVHKKVDAVHGAVLGSKMECSATVRVGAVYKHWFVNEKRSENKRKRIYQQLHLQLRHVNFFFWNFGLFYAVFENNFDWFIQSFIEKLDLPKTFLMIFHDGEIHSGTREWIDHLVFAFVVEERVQARHFTMVASDMECRLSWKRKHIHTNDLVCSLFCLPY